MKKPIYKKWYFWLLIIILLIAFSGKGTNKNQSKNTPPPESTTETTSFESESPLPDTQISKKSLNDYLPFLKTIIEDNFPSDTYDTNIYTDEDTVYFELSAEGLVLNLMENPEEAKELSSSLLAMTEKCWENEKIFMEDENVHFVFNLLNDRNKERIIIYILDNTIIYDATAELN